MILVLGFPIFFFLSLKYFLFFNSVILLKDFFFLLSSVSFLVYILLDSFKFFYVDLLSKIFYKYIFFLMLVLMNLCFFCDNYYLFIFFFEGSVFPMIYMIMNYSVDEDKIFSSMFMMVMNLLGSMPFMISFTLLLNFTGSFNVFMDFWSSIISISSLYLFFLFYFIFLFKLPLMFFHFWLPKAHVSASGPCSIVLASLMLKLGSLGIYKFLFIFCYLRPLLLTFFLCILGFTFIFLLTTLIRSVDLKYLVAISSVVHMTPIPMMILFNNFSGLFGSVLFMVGHGFISAILFFLVTLIYEHSFSRSILLTKGFDKISKIKISFFVFFILLNFGFPPFISFVSEFLMLFCCFFSSIYVTVLFGIYMILCNVIFIISSTKLFIFKSHIISFSDMNFMFIHYMSSSILFLVLCPFMLV